MKRVPVQIQLFMILFLVLVLPMSIITYYSSTSMMRYSEEEIADSAMKKLDSNSELIELALQNVILDVLQMVKENKFNSVKNIKSYDTLNSKYETINNALTILNGMKEMQTNDKIVYSIFFYLDNADYVFSTNKGLVRLINFEDMGWLNDALEKITGAGGVWYPRILNKATVTEIQRETNYSESIHVISYVYRLNRLTTSTKGTIVVNVKESEVSNFLNSKKNIQDTSSFLMDSKGNIISHDDKSLILTNISDSSFIHNILSSGQNSGYEFMDIKGERTLFTYYKTNYNWIYVTSYSMDTLMQKSNEVRANYMLLTIMIIAIGTVVTVFISTSFSKPMKQLVKNMKKQQGIELKGSKNELSFLTTAFEKIKEQEEGLHKLLRDREEETKYLALHKLLTGEVTNDTENMEIAKAFPYHHFIIALVTIDNMKSYLKEVNAEVRSYQRYLLFDKFEHAFPADYRVSCSRYETGTIAILINIQNYDQGVVNKTLNRTLFDLMKVAKEVRGYTVTIGVSGVHTGLDGIKECIYEASEAVKQRLLTGRNSLNFWSLKDKEEKHFHYCYNSEKRILNFLNVGDFLSIKSEINDIIKQINEADNISYDNILLIFNQLVGATIKYLVEHNMNTSKVFRSNINIYSVIDSLDTIEEIGIYLTDIYKSILDYTSPDKDNKETKYYDQVTRYIKEHYNQELIFEDIANKLGISYSYLRKLVKEETGKSLMDNINILRIEEVKRLLLHSNLNISQIAKEVGYQNVQSVNRFFKKYEGITPSEFKNLRQQNLT
jgi:AraC-like DNA-binding protein